jgi:hypothetical protein
MGLATGVAYWQQFGLCMSKKHRFARSSKEVKKISGAGRAV